MDLNKRLAVLEKNEPPPAPWVLVVDWGDEPLPDPVAGDVVIDYPGDEP